MDIESDRLQRLHKWMEGKPQGPVSIHIDPSNRCNVRCRFCWQRSHERMGLVDTKNELSEEKLLSIAKEAAALKVREWLISGGGEPTIRGDATIRLMEAIKRYGMDGDIISNGTLFKEADIRKLVSLSWNRVRVSINGPAAKIHDNLVSVEGSFDRAVGNLRLFQRYKKELKKSLPEIGFNTVINSANYRHFPEMVELLHDIGGCLMNVQTIILYDEEEKKWTLDEAQRKDLNAYLDRAIALCGKYGIHTNMRDYLDREVVDRSNELSQMDRLMENEYDGFLGASCFEPWYLVTIRANGIVGSCRLFGDAGVGLHDKSLKEIWYGEYFTRAREALVRKEVPAYCKNCGANEFMQNRKIRQELARLAR